MLRNDVVEKLMREALAEATAAAARGDEPFGAVLCDKDGTVVARSGNRENTENNPAMHAETALIREACRTLGTKDLGAYTVVTNAECCPMCACALTLAGIRSFYVGAEMEAFCNPYIRLKDVLARAVWPVTLVQGVLKDECAAMIADARKNKQASDLSLNV